MKRWINRWPSRPVAALLGALPFVLVFFLYIWGSNLRLQENPNDKLLPAFSQIGTAMDELVLQPSARTGEYLFWQDTQSSLRRLGLGVLAAASLGLLVGLLTGALPMLGAGLTPFVTAVSLIPPMAVLPILFIVFGLDELSKVMLIVIGIAPTLVRSVYQNCRELPAEQWVKAQTLGANSGQVMLRVLLPQLTPRLVDAVRLSLGSAWLFLIAAEAIASNDGLGYRIFLVRRYMAMDVILPYVAWITLLAFFTDYALARLNRWAFPWYNPASRH